MEKGRSRCLEREKLGLREAKFFSHGKVGGWGAPRDPVSSCLVPSLGSPSKVSCSHAFGRIQMSSPQGRSREDRRQAHALTPHAASMLGVTLTRPTMSEPHPMLPGHLFLRNVLTLHDPSSCARPSLEPTLACPCRSDQMSRQAPVSRMTSRNLHGKPRCGSTGKNTTAFRSH